MKCKACGNVIPSELLRKDSFTCPSCGKAYRRSTKSDAPAADAGRRRAYNDDGERTSGSERQGAKSGILLRITACAVVVALILSIVALVMGMRSKSFVAYGQIKGVKVAGNKYMTVPVDIPAQPNDNYMVLFDINTSAVSAGIMEKTPTSFTVGLTNRINDARTVNITWTLVPYQLPADQ